MTTGTGIAVAGMWAALAFIAIGYQYIEKPSGLSPFGLVVVLIIGAICTYNLSH